MLLDSEDAHALPPISSDIGPHLVAQRNKTLWAAVDYFGGPEMESASVWDIWFQGQLRLAGIHRPESDSYHGSSPFNRSTT